MTRILVKLGRGTEITGVVEEAMKEYIRISRSNTGQQRELAERIENLIKEEER